MKVIKRPGINKIRGKYYRFPVYGPPMELCGRKLKPFKVCVLQPFHLDDCTWDEYRIKSTPFEWHPQPKTILPDISDTTC